MNAPSVENMLDDLYLYGGVKQWNSSGWTTSDDRVRGGSSISHLTVSPDAQSASFHGHLDTSTLGGAGFASQHSAGTEHWDLSAYDGILLTIETSGASQADAGKRFLITLKDAIPGRRDDGREQSGISWEAEFTNSPAAPGDGGERGTGQRHVFLGWDAFEPTYRGRPKPDAEPLDKSDIKRIGLMMRSFFGQQDGDFSLVIRDIRAAAQPSAPIASSVEASQRGLDRQAQGGGDEQSEADEDEDPDLRKGSEGAASGSRHDRGNTTTRGSSWWRGVFCGLL